MILPTDKFRPPDRPIIDKPFRMCVSDVFKGMGAGFFVGGTIQAGNIQAGDRVTVIPAGETASVRSNILTLVVLYRSAEVTFKRVEENIMIIIICNGA